MPTSSIPPEFEIVDPHIHQWDLLNTPRILSPVKKLLGWNHWLYEKALLLGAKKCDRDYVGLVDHVAYDYLPANYRQDAAHLNVSHIVHVEAEWQHKAGLGPAEETAWVDRLFKQAERDTGIALGASVGYVEFEKPSIRALLQAHQTASLKCRGVRQMLAFDNDKGIMRFCQTPGLTRQTQWLKGFELLDEFEMSFDAWFFHHQLDELNVLAKRFPNTQFILCHMGTPIGLGGPFASYGHTGAERDRILNVWKEGIARVAENPNVVVKLSGFFMPVVGWGFHQREQAVSMMDVIERFQPMLRYVLECFGVERAMFASNFPMDKVSMSLQTLYSVYWALVDDLSDAQKALLFRDNAKRIYKIGV